MPTRLVQRWPQVSPDQLLAELVPVDDQAVALRVLVDRLYNREMPVLASGVPADKLFPDDRLNGGYRKKYLRAISRLVALAGEA